MKSILLKVIICVVTITWVSKLYSQEKTFVNSKLLFHIKTGYFIGDSKWEFEHPIYSGTGGVHYETVDGISKGGISYEGGLEWRKNKLGLELAIGIKPSQIIVYLGQSISVEHTYNFNTNYIEIDANYYFKTVNENFRPLIGIGIGYIKLTGDSKTNGALLNFAGGICYSPFKKISVNAGIDGRLTYYINYVESELVNEYFTRTIHFFPIVIYLGFSFQLN